MIAELFIQLTIILGIATIAALVLRLLRQPFIIAYLISGIIAGPALFDILSANQTIYDIFAQMGILLLLFVVGLSLNITHVRRIGKVAIVVGIVQCIITSGVGFLLLVALHLPFLTAAFVAIAATFSSTIIITKLLGDKKDTDAVYGRYTIGLMVVQDVIAIVLMLLLTTTKTYDALPITIAVLLLKGSLIILSLLIIHKYLLPRILDYVAATGELLLLFALSWCFSIAAIVHFVGFSFEIGAIAAGLMLGSSLYRTEIGSRIRPIRDFFLVIFFLLLGSKLTIPNISSAILPGLILAVFVLVGNPIILYTLFRAHRFTRRNSFLIGLTAAQVSEFGFVLLFTGIQRGLIAEETIAVFTVTALITLFTSSYLIIHNEGVYRFFLPMFLLLGKDAHQQIEERIPAYSIWVIGYHRIGWKICERLAEKKLSFAVIDFNPETIALLRRRGIPAYFGDVADVEFLSELPVHKSHLVISTIPDVEDQITIIRHIRAHSKSTYIIANLTDMEHLDTLYHVGASYVMMPHLLGGNWIAELLDHPHITRRTFARLRKHQTQELKHHASQ